MGADKTVGRGRAMTAIARALRRALQPAVTCQSLLASGASAAGSRASGVSGISSSSTAGADWEVECVVVGAGVVGCAVAAALAREGREVLLVERHGTLGYETSSRNSEGACVHARVRNGTCVCNALPHRVPMRACAEMRNSVKLQLGTWRCAAGLAVGLRQTALAWIYVCCKYAMLSW